MSEMILKCVKSKFMMELDSRLHIESTILQTDSWEPHIDKVFDYMIKPNWQCVDVGANSGFHTLSFANLASNMGHVYSFEPLSINRTRLLKNVSINPDLKTLITVEPLALSNCEGTLYAASAGPAGNGVVRTDQIQAEMYGEFQEQCSSTTIDIYFAKKKIDLLKIDVEGMELEVIQGGLNTIQRDRPIICYETLVETFDPTKLQTIYELLASLNYRMITLDPRIGKLVRVIPPDYYPDTFAVPEEKCINFAEVAVLGAEYNCRIAGQAEVDSRLVFMSFGRGEVFFELNLNNASIKGFGFIKQDKVQFTLNCESSTYKFNAIFDSIALTYAECVLQFQGSVIALTAEKKAGNFDYTSIITM